VIPPTQATVRVRRAAGIITTVAYARALVAERVVMFAGRTGRATEALDIDTEFDFRMAELLMQDREARRA
jgi:hypothetical protein